MDEQWDCESRTEIGRGGEAISRRGFLARTAAAGAGLAMASESLLSAEGANGDLPTRVLGRTKEKVTILGLGTAPIGEGPVETKEATRIFGEVMDRGVNYIDTARIYGNAEEALAPLLPSRRDKLFLVTKIWADTADRAETIFTESLRQLKVDHVDLVHIHNIGSKDVAKVLGKGGIMEYLLKQKRKGALRFIGMSGHNRPPRMLEVIETGLIDVVMPVINYADCNTYDNETKILPECRKRNIGVVAMKVYAGIKGGFKFHKKGYVGCATKKDLLPRAMAYALDLPGVSSAVVGPYTLTQAIENVEFAKRYKPLTAEQRQALLAEGKKLAAEMGPRYGPVA